MQDDVNDAFRISAVNFFDKSIRDHKLRVMLAAKSHTSETVGKHTLYQGHGNRCVFQSEAADKIFMDNTFNFRYDNKLEASAYDGNILRKD